MSRTFILHSPLEDDLQFLSMTGSEELSKVSVFNVRAVSLNPDIDATEMLGQNVTVEVITQEGNSRYLDGIVTQFTYMQPESGASRQHLYNIRLQSWLALAEKRSDSKVFQKKNVPDIIKEALADFGLPFEFKLTDVYKPRRFLVQYQESNLNLVKRLAEEVGIYFYTKHALGSHTIVFTDGIHSTLDEYDTIEYLTPGSRPMEADEYIKEWNVVHEVQSGAYVTDSFNFQAPNANLQRNDQKQNDHAFDSLEIYDFHGGYPEHDDGTKIAKTRLEQHQRNFLNISGETNVRGMAPGYYFNLTDHPSDSQNDEYLITSATYSFQENPFGSNQQNTTWNIRFNAKPSSTRFQPEAKTVKPTISGPQSAIVTGPAGSDIWCDKWGRVVIQFAWDRLGKYDENSSCWVRVSSPWAGSNYGGVHVPRVGQEVIVEFLHGNPDLPLITGRVYNDSQLPPWDLPANATQSGFISRSSGKGQGKDNANALRFEDKKGHEHVWLQAEKDMQTVVENNDTQTVGANRVIEVGGTHTETIKKDTAIAITEGNLTTTVIKGNQVTTISKGDQTNEVTTGSQVNTVKGDIAVISQNGEFILTSPKQITLVVGSSTIVIGPNAIKLQSARIDLNPGGGGSAPAGGGSAAAAAPEAKPPVQTGLGGGVDKLAAKSPSLQKKLADLQAKGWKFEYGAKGSGGFAKRDGKPPTIYIDGNSQGNDVATVQTLSHEAGHAEYNYKPDYSSKTAYVNGALADEGAATMSNIQTQRDITANGGPDIGIAGNSANQPAYNAAYNQYLQDGDASKAQQAIGQVYGNGERASVPVNGQTVPYNQYYGSWYDKNFPGK